MLCSFPFHILMVSFYNGVRQNLRPVDSTEEIWQYRSTSSARCLQYLQKFQSEVPYPKPKEDDGPQCLRVPFRKKKCLKI